MYSGGATFIVRASWCHLGHVHGSVMVAAKFFDDQYYNNAYYAKVRQGVRRGVDLRALFKRAGRGGGSSLGRFKTVSYVEAHVSSLFLLKRVWFQTFLVGYRLVFGHCRTRFRVGHREQLVS